MKYKHDPHKSTSSLMSSHRWMYDSGSGSAVLDDPHNPEHLFKMLNNYTFPVINEHAQLKLRSLYHSSVILRDNDNDNELLIQTK